MGQMHSCTAKYEAELGEFGEKGGRRIGGSRGIKETTRRLLVSSNLGPWELTPLVSPTREHGRAGPRCFIHL